MLNGNQLRHVFLQLDPFSPTGELKSEAERRTLLAVNVNPPAELALRGFLEAAAESPGSPLILQASYNALGHLGAPGAVPRVQGAKLFQSTMRCLGEQYGVRNLALALDHYRVPPFPTSGSVAGSHQYQQAQARVEAAQAFLQGKGAEITRGAHYPQMVEYLASHEYQAFAEELLTLVSAMRPAYTMIDTERLPLVLTAAVAHHLRELVEQAVGIEEMMWEVEYGATGRSPQATGYEARENQELEAYAQDVAALVQYTQADAISYPIGLVHGAALHQTYEPDRQRLFRVQAQLKRDIGRYVPFVQHGGSSARTLLRGLVGKNNLNTTFLIAQAQALAAYIQENQPAIRAGDKGACGNPLFAAAIAGVRQATQRRLDQAGTRRANAWLLPLSDR